MQVICVGHAALDIILELDGYPEEDTKATASRRSVTGGGPAANAAALLGFWGIDAAFAGPVGDDQFGSLIREELAEYGVDTAAVAAPAGYPTPVSSIIVNAVRGTRTIVNHRVVADLYRLPDALDWEAPRVLLFDGHALDASREAMRRWPEAATVLDAGSLRDSTRSLAAEVDYVVASEAFAASLLGRSLSGDADRSEALELLYGINGGCAVITLGALGGIWARDHERGSYAAYPVPAVDSTAAGDIFHGAFAFALAEGRSFEDTLAFAAVAAGLSTAKPGGRASFPTLEEVRRALERGDHRGCAREGHQRQ